MNLMIVGAFIEYDPTERRHEELYAFYSTVFSKAGEIENLRRPERHIGYECELNRKKHLVFLGFEVSEAGGIPDGFSHMEIGDEEIRFKPRSDAAVRVLPVHWRWKEILHVHGQGWIVGDFDSPIGEFTEITGGQTGEFWTNFNIFGKEEIEGGDRVELVEYQESWPEEFSRFREYLLRHFSPEILTTIEHFGSTSIPGMPAKPVIDMLIEVPSFSEARKGMLPLIDETWEYCWYEEHAMFIKRNAYRGKRTHHLHLVTPGHERWGCIAFRNFLRDRPEKARNYAALKAELAKSHYSDRERYTWSKTAFVQEHTEEAIRRGY